MLLTGFHSLMTLNGRRCSQYWCVRRRRCRVQSVSACEQRVGGRGVCNAWRGSRNVGSQLPARAAATPSFALTRARGNSPAATGAANTDAAFIVCAPQEGGTLERDTQALIVLFNNTASSPRLTYDVNDPFRGV